MKPFKSSLVFFNRSIQGLAAMEFALILPLFLVITFGMVEVANQIYAKQKLESATHNVLNLITLYENLSDDQIETITDVFPYVTEPYTADEADYRVVISAVQRDVDIGSDVFEEPYTLWQVDFGNAALGNSAIQYSDSATKEANKIDPVVFQGFHFEPGDQLIIVESYMKYTPTVWAVSGQDAIYKRISGRPRKGAFQFKPSEIR